MLIPRALLLQLLVLTCVVVPCTAADDPWAAVPKILERIEPPRFPDRDYVITSFGAVAGGETDCSAAFSKAIATCHADGGGRVVVSAGRFLSGPIHLKSNVELHLANGAEIVFSDRFEDYLPPVLVRVGGIELYNYSPHIYARDCKNIAVTGPGKLNGNAKAWWPWAREETKRHFELGAKGAPVESRIFGERKYRIRPSFLSFVNCTNILLEDFEIGSSPNWTIHPIYCQNTTIRGVRIVTDGPNNDGIDPDSCRDVLIENCTFDTGDDCVVLKSGYNQDGWRVGRPTENVIVRKCSSKRGHGGVVVGSEMSGDVRNVFVEDCHFEGTDRIIRIKSRADRGGVVEHIYARNLIAKNMQREAIILTMDYSADKSAHAESSPPVFRHMRFENIRCQGAPVAIQMQGTDDSRIRDIVFRDVDIESHQGVVAANVERVSFENLSIKSEEAPVYELTNATDVSIRGDLPEPVAEPFLSLQGAESDRVVIHSSGPSDWKPQIRFGDGVSTQAVVVE